MGWTHGLFLPTTAAVQTYSHVEDVVWCVDLSNVECHADGDGQTVGP